MKQKHSLYNRFNVFGTLLVSTLLPCFLATLFLGVVFLPAMSRTASNHDEASAQLIMDAAAGSFEDLYDSTGELTAAVEHSSWVHSLYLDTLNEIVPGSALRGEITHDLNKACVRAGAKSLSFKFYDNNVLYNNRGVVDDQERYEQVYRDNIQYLFYTSNAQEEVFSTITFDGVEYLLYQIPFRDIDGGRYKGEINILFQSSVLGAKLDRAAGSEAAAFRMTDLDGNCVWQYNTNLFDEETVTLSRLSNSGKYYFCVDIPVSVRNQTQKDVLPTVLLTLAISLVISACISYVLSRTTYRPIQKIVQKFVGQDESADNDFDALERVFDRAISEKNRIENALDQLRPIAEQKVIGSLLNGTAVLQDSLDDDLAYCNIRFPYERFNVIDLEAPFSQVEEQELGLTAELAMETLLKHLQGQLPLKAYLYYEDSDHYRILVNYQSWENLQAYLSALSTSCKTHFQKYAMGENIRLGVGHAVFSLEEIYRAAEQAETAFNVAAVNRLDQPMFYRELESELSIDYFYPLSEEMLLSRAITNCNTEGAKAILYAIIEENRSKKQLNPKCLLLLYMDLSSTVARSGQSLGILLPPVDMKDAFLSLEEICKRVEVMIDELCRQIMNRRQKSMNRTEQAILEYIDEHLYDQDLSLNSIAERFQKSSAYISLLFKEQRGTNYNSYVNQNRIMRAVQLLNDEKLDANTVYPMVGYVSLSTFRRNFSKYAKCNPGAVSALEE